MSRSYAMTALDAETELPRLELQAKVARELEKKLVERCPLSPTDTVVDIGCGPGFFTETLATFVPDGWVFGVDIDEDLLTQARTGVEHPRSVFLHGSADALPLPAEIADLVYARFLLQHVPDPVGALAEMKRVAKPGARVMTLDTDDGAIVMHPEPVGLRRLLRASRIAQRDLGGDRHAGRKLRSWYAEAGFEEAHVELVPFTSEMVGIEAWVELVLGFKAQIIPPDLMSAAEIARTLDACRGLAQVEGAFAQTLAYFGDGMV